MFKRAELEITLFDELNVIQTSVPGQPAIGPGNPDDGNGGGDDEGEDK